MESIVEHFKSVAGKLAEMGVYVGEYSPNDVLSIPEKGVTALNPHECWVRFVIIDDSRVTLTPVVLDGNAEEVVGEKIVVKF